jgi:hypothetical protein
MHAETAFRSTPRRLDRRSRLLLSATVLVALAFGGTIGAQIPEGWRAGSHYQRELVPSQRSGFMFCRLNYTSVRREADGMGWSTDYPMADKNLMTRLSDFTTAEVNRYGDGEVAHAVVRATDDELFLCPFLFASDVGTAGFDSEEVERLREYLLKGGFLWVDDFWGDMAMWHWLEQMEKVLPGHRIITIDTDHPIFSTYYSLAAIPQIPHIGFWRRTGGQTSERGAESAVPTMTAITDYDGRVVVVMTHNTDIADGWEREADDYDFFSRFSPPAYAVGINVAIFSMTR